MTTTINGSKLHTLTENSKTADAIATALAARQRTRGFVDIRRLRIELMDHGFEFVEADAIDFFKKLEAEGHGTLIRSRKYGVAARFLWKYDMKKVCSAIVNGNDVKTDELPKEMQREHDGPRTRKAQPKLQSKPLKSKRKREKPVLLQDSGLKVVVNGRQFLDISEEDYQELQRLRAFVAGIKKLIK